MLTRDLSTFALNPTSCGSPHRRPRVEPRSGSARSASNGTPASSSRSIQTACSASPPSECGHWTPTPTWLRSAPSSTVRSHRRRSSPA